MLIDSFNRKINYLRISVTDRCDLRCIYCIPKGFKNFEEPTNWLNFDELVGMISVFAKLGINSIRLTGGEPLLRKNLADLIFQIKSIQGINDISITTNGTQLLKNIYLLKKAGLDRLNVSLDSLDSDTLVKITGSNIKDKVILGLLEAKKLGFNNIKINTVLLDNINLDNLEHLIEFCWKHGFVLRLIEPMPMGITGRKMKRTDTYSKVNKLINYYDLKEYNNSKLGEGPANYWKSKDGKFCLGLIAPMSKKFCNSCNRVRLTVDGTLYTCLGQNNSYALGKIIRSNNYNYEEIEKIILKAILLKPKEHDFIHKPNKIIRIMSMTGG